jgi:hypothetical protein
LSHLCALLSLYCSATPNADEGKAIRAALTVLEGFAYTADVVLGVVDGIECPSPEAGACSGPKTASVQLALAVKVILETVRQGQRFDDRLHVLHCTSSHKQTQLTSFTVTVQLATVGNKVYGELVDWDEFTKNELANNGKVLYDNMNKMLGVEKATKTVADAIFTEVTRKQDFTPGVKFAGCDGVDQDTKEDAPNGFGPRRYGVVDECEEDTYPPEIVLHESLPVKLDCMSADAVCLDKLFRNQTKAIAYMKATIGVTDDCTPHDMLDTEISFVGVGSLCGENEFKVTPISKAVCDAGFAIEGTPKTFIVDIDAGNPQVSCGFRATPVPEEKKEKLTRWVDGKNLFVRLEGGSKWNPVDTGIFYEVAVRSLNVSWIRSRKAVVDHCANINCSCFVTLTGVGQLSG